MQWIFLRLSYFASVSIFSPPAASATFVSPSFLTIFWPSPWRKILWVNSSGSRSFQTHPPKSRCPNDDVCGLGWTSTDDFLGISALEAAPCPELCESVWTRCSARTAGPWRWCLRAAACWGQREHRAVLFRTGPSGLVLDTRFRSTETPWRGASSRQGSTAFQRMRWSSQSKAPLPENISKSSNWEHTKHWFKTHPLTQRRECRDSLTHVTHDSHDHYTGLQSGRSSLSWWMSRSHVSVKFSQVFLGLLQLVSSDIKE